MQQSDDPPPPCPTSYSQMGAPWVAMARAARRVLQPNMKSVSMADRRPQPFSGNSDSGYIASTSGAISLVLLELNMSSSCSMPGRQQNSVVVHTVVCVTGSPIVHSYHVSTHDSPLHRKVVMDDVRIVQQSDTAVSAFELLNIRQRVRQGAGRHKAGCQADRVRGPPLCLPHLFRCQRMWAESVNRV